MDSKSKMEIWKQTMRERQKDENQRRQQSSYECSVNREEADWTTVLEKLQNQVAEIRKYVKVWVKKEQLQRNKASIRIQCVFRGYLIRKQYYRSERTLCNVMPVSNARNTASHSIKDTAAVQLQRLVRGFLIRQRLIFFRQQINAATLIQSQWKGYRARDLAIIRKYTLIRGTGGSKWNIVKPALKSLCKRVDKHDQRISEVQVNTDAHTKALRLLWNEMNLLKQKVASQEERTMRRGITKFQTHWRGYSARKKFSKALQQLRKDKEIVRGIKKFQTRWRGHCDRKLARSIRRRDKAAKGIVKLQTQWRMHLAKAKYTTLRNEQSVIQRGVLTHGDQSETQSQCLANYS